jgi:hypothetical protein
MNTRTPCHFAYNARGKLNRKHQCRPSCAWDWRDCLDWLNRTPVLPGREPTIRCEHVCTCGQPYDQHFASAVDRNGKLAGIRSNPDYNCGGTITMRHLQACDCLTCITERITADKAVAAA